MIVSAILRAVEGADAAQRRCIERAVARLGEADADAGFLPAVAGADSVETRWTPLHGQWRTLSGPEIADELAISLNTLRTHTKHIFEKLGVNSRRAAVSRAEELELFTRVRQG